MLVYAALVAVPLLLWIAWAAVRIRRQVRQYRGILRSHQGLCATCGYDLQGSPQRCPECGTVARIRPD